MAIQTGIAPNDLLETPPEILRCMLEVLGEQGEQASQQQLAREIRGRM